MSRVAVGLHLVGDSASSEGDEVFDVNGWVHSGLWWKKLRSAERGSDDHVVLIDEADHRGTEERVGADGVPRRQFVVAVGADHREFIHVVDFPPVAEEHGVGEFVLR